MPEYLTPGVYLEETSFRSRSIEGVATSTFGMAGLTRYGPVPYHITLPNRELFMVPSPTLVTSFTEFERAFGGLGPVGTASDDHQLPGVRGARVLRQRRPPAVRRPCLPVHAGTRRQRHRPRAELRVPAGRCRRQPGGDLAGPLAR